MSRTKELIERVSFTLEAAPAYMESLADSLRPASRGELSGDLDALLQATAWRYGYMDARHGGGCGDQGHEAAVKAANKLLRAVRKAIGYTYPERAAIRV